MEENRRYDVWPLNMGCREWQPILGLTLSDA